MDFEQIVRWYFAGEKAEAFWILAAGVVSLVGALVLIPTYLVLAKLNGGRAGERRSYRYAEL